MEGIFGEPHPLEGVYIIKGTLPVNNEVSDIFKSLLNFFAVFQLDGAFVSIYHLSLRGDGVPLDKRPSRADDSYHAVIRG